MTKIRKILLISTSSGSRGGGEIYLQRLATGLSARGMHVSVLLSDHSRMDELAGGFGPTVQVVRKPFQNTYDKRFRFLSEIFGSARIAQLQRDISELSPQVVHLNKQNLEDGIDWLRALRGFGVPSLATIHVTNAMSDLGAKFGAFRDGLLRSQLKRNCRHVIAVSNASRATYERFLGGEPGILIRTIPNGVPPAPRSEEGGRTYRREWNLPDDSFVLGTVARIEEQKNPLFAVRLLARLPERVHLVWVGDGRLRAAMERLATESGVSERLHIDGWKQDARERMSAFDLFLLPSRYEGFPLAILEAMSAGLPCVVSAVDGNVESVVHGRTGLLLPPEQIDRWETELIGLLNSPEHLHEMGTAGEQRYREHYSLEAMTDQTLDFYEQLVESTTNP